VGSECSGPPGAGAEVGGGVRRDDDQKRAPGPLRATLSLTAKLSLGLLLLALTSVAAHAAFQRFLILPQFHELERAEAVRDVERCMAAINAEAVHLAHTCEDWARSDDAYDLVAAGDASHLAKHVSPRALQDAELDLICFVRPGGEILWGEVRDPHVVIPATLRAFEAGRFEPDDAILRLACSDEVTSGLVSSELGLLLMAAQPVLRSDATGPSNALLVVGRLLDARAFATVAEQTGLQIHAWPVEKGFIDPGVPEAAARALLAARLDLGFGAELVFDETEQETLHVYATLPDAEGRPAVVLRMDRERSILLRAKGAMGVANIFMIVASLLLPMLLWIVLHRAVVGPISFLTRNVVRIGLDGDMSRRIPVARADELGALAVEFNSMLGRLERVQGRLLHAAQHDPLTGLPNRVAILELLERTVDEQQGEPDRSFALLYVDIDGFKPVNDTHGHDVGDALLVAIAERLQANTRAGDRADGVERCTAARLGGDEFVVLLDGTSELAEAQAVADRLEKALSAPYTIGTECIRIGASIGVSVRENENEPAEDVLCRADAAMYREKARRHTAG